MTIWHLHNLNSRHQLTAILPEIRSTARQAVAQASECAALPDFDMVIRGQTGTSDSGLSAQSPAPALIEVTLNPDRFDPAQLNRALIRQFYHLIRWDGPGYGKSLGEALASEGLAGHFVLQVLGGKPDPCDATTPSPGTARRAMTEWSRLTYDHAEWFLGKGKIRKWSGYGLGHRLIAEHLSQHPDDDPVTLSLTRADAFREAMRRLAKADGEPATDEPETREDMSAAGKESAETEPAPTQLKG